MRSPAYLSKRLLASFAPWGTVSIVLWVLACLVAAAAGFLAAGPVARRAASWPIPDGAPASWFVLAAVWARPSRLAYLDQLPTQAFDYAPAREVFQAMRDVSDLPPITSDKQAQVQAAALEADEAGWRRRVRDHLGSTEVLDMLHDRSLWDAFAKGENLHSPSSDKAVLAAASQSLRAYDEHAVAPFHARFDFFASAEPTPLNPGRWVRLPARLGIARRLALALSAALWMAPAFVLAQVSPSPVLAVLSWVVLGAGLLVVSFVDHDTMSLDFPAWAVALLGGWGFAVAASISQPSRLLAGVVSALVVAALFEILNRVFLALRGQYGQGFGDTLIVLASVGVPAALTGSWMVGYVSLMVALLTAIAAFAVRRAVRSASRHEPFAFGPWLTAGPPAALLALWLFPSLF